MTKNLKYVAFIIFIAVIFFYLRKPSNDIENDTTVKFWQSQPTASVSIDTMFYIDTPRHQGGLLFTAVTKENLFALVEAPMLQKRKIEDFNKFMSAGFQHGNYSIVNIKNTNYCITAKHVMEENMSRVRDYGWLPDPAHDVMLKPTGDDNPNNGRIANLMDASTSLNERGVEISGYRAYPNKNYILYFKIRGKASKVIESMVKNSRPLEEKGIHANTFSEGHDLFMLKIPTVFQSDVMGLSGSGVYLVGINGKVTDTLVGVQSSRMAMATQNTETGEINVMHLGIAFEKM